MFYIKKGSPLRSVTQKTAEIQRRDLWKKLPDMVPDDEREAAGYTGSLRSMFEEFPKQDIRETEIREQHGLCCYCMRRISSDAQSIVIEHWYPMNRNKNKAIEYGNFSEQVQM